MGRRRLLWLVLGACVLLLTLPGIASAASYTWDQPANFTVSPPGANPDHDAYGGTPWSYDEGPACTGLLCTPSNDPTGFTALPTFASGTWSDGSSTYIGVNSSDTAHLQIGASSTAVTALGWTNPLGHQATVTVTGTVGTATTGTCNWSLDQGGASQQSGSSSGAISDSLLVPAGGSFYLDVTSTTILGGPCAIPVTLHITESEATNPTLTAPTGTVNTSLPTFSGTGSTAYGSAAGVAVKIFQAGGNLYDTATATRDPTTGAFSIQAPHGLPDGTYTAQASQTVGDEIDTSNTVTFTVSTSTSPPPPPASFTLNSPGTSPLSTATPSFTGAAATATGDGAYVAFAVYAGASPTGAVVRYFPVPRDASTGAFSVTVAPALPDGQYTAIAAQQGSSGVLYSNPVTFRVKVNAPALTPTAPRPGGSLYAPHPTFTGAAGSTLDDDSTVSVTLHSGNSAAGRSLGTQRVPVMNGTWSLRWPSSVSTGIYTVVVSQGDDVGHTTTIATTFILASAPQIIGSRVSLKGTTASLAVTCTASSGTCAGTVLALTTKRLRTRAGGPAGAVRVIFVYTRIPAGRSTTVRMRLPGYVASALRRVHGLQVKVTVTMVGLGRASATRPLAG